MSTDFAPTNLTHHFLIAMPGLDDPAFARSVVYLCEHSERGALGLLINKPTDLHLQGLFDKIDLDLQRPDLAQAPVFLGGPVQTDRGFVLHDPMRQTDPPNTESAYASTLHIAAGPLDMTTSRDVLEALSNGAGPRRVLVALGYSAWAEGQLESELAQNSWLTVEADLSVIFDTPIEQRYDQALRLLGLEAWQLAPTAGHA
ncbi:MAG: YqgE/AlgH family protein [Burkholderiaceae bacterium]|nr:YqgE/AlgH family protein [Burkholderiaceae bacterium]